MNFKKATTFEILKLKAYVLKNRLKQTKRDLKLINADYDTGYWSTFNIENFPFGSLMNLEVNNEIEIYQINNDFYKIPRKIFLDLYEKRILELFEHNVEKNSPVVELGSGIGNILFFLWKSGYRNLEGFDLSNTGICIAKDIAKKFNCDIEFSTLNIVEDIRKNQFNDKTIFTYVCLEQLSNYMDQVLENIINSRPQKVINFEFSINNSTKLARDYHKTRDYQTNLYPKLLDLQKNNLIKIISTQPVGYGRPLVPLTCICWKPL